MELSYVFTPLLVLPPLWIALNNKKVNRIPLKLKLTFPLVALLGIALYMVYPYPIYMLYVAIFMVGSIYAKAKGLNDATSFALSVYMVYAVSELWEIPIHLATWITWEALALGLMFSSLKFIAVPLFFMVTYKRGWKPSDAWLYGLAATLSLGSILYSLVIAYGLPSPPAIAFMLHLYRLPWIALFLWAIPKQLNKT